MADTGWLVLVESNTTGSGRDFCAAARARGLRPVVLVKDPARYPYLDAEGIDAAVVDTSDPAAVLRACEDFGPPGVVGVTSSSEYFISAAASAALTLGLPAPDPVAVAACRDKHRQRLALDAAGLLVPAWRLATTEDEAAAAACALGGSLVVKPNIGSGSVGVRRCETPQEVGEAAARLLAAGVDPRVTATGAPVLVESYVSGAEYSVETFDGRIVGVVRKHLGSEPYFVERGHDFPAQVGRRERDALGEVALRALTALGLGWGPSHTELRMAPEGPTVIEVNPRLAGGMIPSVVRAATGVDLIDCSVALVSGQSAPTSATRQGAAAIRFLTAPRAGRVSAVEGVEAAAAMRGVETVRLTVSEGVVIPALTNSFRDRIGFAIAAGDDTGRAAANAEAALRRITVRIEPASVRGS